MECKPEEKALQRSKPPNPICIRCICACKSSAAFHFCWAVEHDDLEQINHLFREQGYSPEETICFAGCPVEHMFVVADGRVKLMQHSLSGRNVLLDMLTPGEFFGSLSSLGDDIYPDTAEAQPGQRAVGSAG